MKKSLSRLWLIVQTASIAWALCVIWPVSWATFKRGFYTFCCMAVFFYAARAMRAVALYFEAKARKGGRL